LARTLDAGPEEILPAGIMFNLAQNFDRLHTTEQISSELVSVKSTFVFKQLRPMLAIIAKNQEELNKIKSMECHNCFATGHQAWECSHPPDKEALKTYMTNPKNIHYKQKQQERRARNYEMKHGFNPRRQHLGRGGSDDQYK
jgi:hypothetical protein